MKKPKIFIVVIFVTLILMALASCRTEFGEWFLMDDMNKVDNTPKPKHIPVYDY